jgi:hypothetical protein
VALRRPALALGAAATPGSLKHSPPALRAELLVLAAADAGRAAWSDGARIYLADLLAEALPRQVSVTGAASVAALALSKGAARLAYALTRGAEGKFRLGVVDLGAAWADDGKDLAEANHDSDVLVGAPRALALSPDGKVVAYVKKDSDELFLWTPAQRVRRRVPLREKPSWPELVFSPNGELLAIPTGQGVLVLRLDGAYPGRRLFALPTRGVAPPKRVAIDDSGRHIAAYSDGMLFVWDLERGSGVRRFPIGAEALALRWTAPGSRLLWATPAGYSQAELQPDGASISDVAFGDGAAVSAVLGSDPSTLVAAVSAPGDFFVRATALDPGPRAAATRPSGASLEEAWAYVLPRLGVGDDRERALRRLAQYAADPLEIFQVAGRKWLAMLAEAGDRDARAAAGSVRRPGKS